MRSFLFIQKDNLTANHDQFQQTMFEIFCMSALKDIFSGLYMCDMWEVAHT